MCIRDRNYEEAKTQGGVVEEHQAKKLGANDYTETHSCTDEGTTAKGAQK